MRRVLWRGERRQDATVRVKLEAGEPLSHTRMAVGSVSTAEQKPASVAE
jgi:hypothetical protein